MTQLAPMWPLPPATLAALPPEALPNLRMARYRGGTLAVSLAVFAARDQATLRTLYQLLTELWTVLTTPPAGGSTLLQMVGQFAARPDWQQVRAAMQELGTATQDPTLDLVIHDLRGGSFTALVGTLDLLTRARPPARALPTLVVLVRDRVHALRNLVPDLDVTGAAADQQPQPQPVERLVEKWRLAPAQVGNHVARVNLDVAVQGAVAARPSELAALDAVLTNLVNNAVRFAVDRQVYLVVLPHATGRDVRVVVSNELTADHQATLTARFGTDWRGLFAGEFTTGGTGLGLRICAAYVAECYGLAGTRQAIDGQYLAAIVWEAAFVAYFHWPLVPTSSRGTR